MDPEAVRTGRESLELAFHMSNILDTGLERHTLFLLPFLICVSILRHLLAAADVKELKREKLSSLSSSLLPAAPSSLS